MRISSVFRQEFKKLREAYKEGSYSFEEYARKKARLKRKFGVKK
jgi:hypothetical protein